MGFSTFPNNPFPPSTAQFEEGKNDAIQAEIDAMKDGANIDSFGDVESALALKANNAEMQIALATKTNLSNIAPSFDATSGVYAVGDKVIYDDVLYEFTSTHSTAGEWDESEAQPVKVSELIDSLKSGLIVDKSQSTEPVDVGGTFQIGANVLSHNIIIVGMHRYAYGASVVLQKAVLDAGSYANGCGIYVNNGTYVHFTVSGTGLVTIIDIPAEWGPVNIMTYGIL